MPITSIIFSRDRPSQLDLFLSRVEKVDVNNVFEEKIVIYKCSNEKYSEAYQNLRNKHPDVSFWTQGRSLFNDVDVAVSCSLSSYISFFTDDCFADRYKASLGSVSEDWLRSAFDNKLISHVALSLDKNVPMLTRPLSLNGNIFKQSTVQKWTEELCYLEKIKKWKQNPNELERVLQRFSQECGPLVAVPTEYNYLLCDRNWNMRIL